MPKDDATWLNVAYAILFTLSAYIGYKALYTVGISFGWVERYDSWFPAAMTVFGLVIGAVVTFVVRRNTDRHEYYLAALGEIRKVTWPTWADTKRMTLVVVVVVAVFAVILAGFDLVWGWALKSLIG